MKERESNIEAARILAMILVVLVHANYFSLGGIDRSDIIASPSSGQGENPVFRITKKYVPLNR